ncbi:MAG: YciI family protein [Planctomycetota bacterium]
MHDYILLMHDDAQDTARADTDAAWGKYLETLAKSGRFLGGSAMGGGKCFTRSGAAREMTAHITGYIRVQADSLDAARKFLEGNPVFEAGGTVEIRELPQS